MSRRFRKPLEKKSVREAKRVGKRAPAKVGAKASSGKRGLAQRAFDKSQETPLHPRSEAKRRGGVGGGGHFAKAAPHPDAFGVDPPHHSQVLAGGGMDSPPCEGCR